MTTLPFKDSLTCRLLALSMVPIQIRVAVDQHPVKVWSGSRGRTDSLSIDTLVIWVISRRGSSAISWPWPRSSISGRPHGGWA